MRPNSPNHHYDRRKLIEESLEHKLLSAHAKYVCLCRRIIILVQCNSTLKMRDIARGISLHVSVTQFYTIDILLLLFQMIFMQCFVKDSVFTEPRV